MKASDMNLAIPYEIIKDMTYGAVYGAGFIPAYELPVRFMQVFFESIGYLECDRRLNANYYSFWCSKDIWILEYKLTLIGAVVGAAFGLFTVCYKYCRR